MAHRPRGGPRASCQNHGVKTVLYPVADLAAATPTYVAPSVESPSSVDLTAPTGTSGWCPAGPVASWHVDDLEAAVAAVVAAGPAREVGSQRRVGSVRALGVDEHTYLSA
ncbi:MAG: hypothetical protein ACP5OV_08185, partial [Acidimicrobiales bacterium]